MIRALSAGVVVVAALTLPGCLATPVYSDLDGPATAEDALPAAVEVDPDGPLEVDSVRYVGEHDGTSFYLGVARTGGHCVTVYRPAGQDWVTGCGVDVTVSGAGVRAAVAPDGARVPENWIRIGNNILVED